MFVIYSESVNCRKTGDSYLLPLNKRKKGRKEGMKEKNREIRKKKIYKKTEGRRRN